MILDLKICGEKETELMRKKKSGKGKKTNWKRGGSENEEINETGKKENGENNVIGKNDLDETESSVNEENDQRKEGIGEIETIHGFTVGEMIVGHGTTENAKQREDNTTGIQKNEIKNEIVAAQEETIIRIDQERKKLRRLRRMEILHPKMCKFYVQLFICLFPIVCVSYSLNF